jgi:hypothetical protein
LAYALGAFSVMAHALSSAYRTRSRHEPSGPATPRAPVRRPSSSPPTARSSSKSEPYGSSPSLDVTLLPGTNGRTTLAFGLPAEGIHGLLELDPSYRITRETLTAPKHQINRSFSYPR